MILYFSGTGNSRHVAQKIAMETEDELVSMNSMMKEKKRGILHSTRPFVFVVPCYTGRQPRVVSDLLESLSFTGNKKAYFIMTAGEDVGNASHYVKQLCETMGLDSMGLGTVVMPNNYLIYYKLSDQETAEKIVKEAEPVIETLTKQIQTEQYLETNPAMTKQKYMSGVINSMFYTFMVKTRGFYATDACVGCGLCARNCPLNNISLVDKKPKWEQTCTHCMACIGCCPTEAIEYKKSTQGKNRYYLKSN